MYNTIIIPTDFSNEDSTIKLLQKAEAFSDNNRIVLMHVLEDLPTYATAQIPADITRNIVPKTRELLRKIVKHSKVEAGTEVRSGKPYRQIINSVKEHDADLIIVNSHQPGLENYLLGSTAAKVVRHAPCSVLVER